MAATRPEAGRQQRLGDARRHHGEVGVLRDRDLLEGVLDAPDRPEQPDERRGRADRRQEGQPRVQRLRFPSRSPHPSTGRSAPARRRSARRPAGGCAAIPACRRRRSARLAPSGCGPICLEQFVQRLARPEGPVEHRSPRAAPSGTSMCFWMMIAQDQNEARDQHEHHDLHREGRADEKSEQGEINLLRRRKGLGFHLPARLLWPHLSVRLLSGDSIRNLKGNANTSASGGMLPLSSPRRRRSASITAARARSNRRPQTPAHPPACARPPSSDRQTSVTRAANSRSPSAQHRLVQHDPRARRRSQHRFPPPARRRTAPARR